jgi:thioredoxin reductase (NADPH)
VIGPWLSRGKVSIVLAVGLIDSFPQIDRFLDHYGAEVFTCGSCDGYEARGTAVAVLGSSTAAAGFATGLLDWASASP